MSVTVTQELTQQTVTVTGNPVENNVTVTVSNARGPAGTGGGGSNSVTSATTSDGTANLSISNVTTATAEVTGTLTANHIHGNLAGNVYAHVRAGEALAKGDPVYVSGSHGSGSTLIAIVSKADASNAAKMPAVGIMDAAVAINANGHMVITGTITEIATNAYSINAELYVAAGGGMTATPPTARAQPVARVERSNLNNGAILVKVNGLSASDATASTLVRRTADGDASFSVVDVGSLTAGGISTTGQVEFNGTDAGDSLTFNMVNYTYGTGAASAHRTALGSGATGDALFTAATPAAARTTLELGAFNTNGSITGTGALTFTSATASNINLTPGTTGFIDISKASAAGIRESILRAKVSDAGDDAFHVFNATSVDSRFTPGFSGSAFSASAQRALQFVAQTTAANDTGITPLMSFEARRTSSTTDPNNGTLSDIATRPLFEWRNVTGSLATMAPNGALSLLATTASASTTTGALIVSGGVGVAGAVNSLYQRVGSGTPEGVVTAPVGAVFHRTDGGAGTSFYVKQSGTGNTGWVGK